MYFFVLNKKKKVKSNSQVQKNISKHRKYCTSFIGIIPYIQDF